MIRYAIGVAFFQISSNADRNAALAVESSLAALVEPSPDGPSPDFGEQFSLIDITRPELRKIDGVITEVQAPVNIQFVFCVSTGTSPAFKTAFRQNLPPGSILEEFGRATPETLQQMRDRMVQLARERACTHLWNTVTHQTTVPAPPIPDADVTANFLPL